MAIKPGDIYKPRRKYSRAVTIVLLVLAVLIVLAALLFNSFQKYIIYDPDGLRLELPFLTDNAGDEADAETPDPVAPSAGDVTAEVVVVAPDFTDTDIGAGEGLSELHAVYVSAESATAEILQSYTANLSGYGADALLIEMKPESGELAWATGVQTALSFGVGGTEDLRDTITALKEKGIYLAAQISVCADEYMAYRNPALALRDETGAVFADESATWLDPYNKNLRTYISALMAELFSMGFDEVVLADLAHPDTDKALIYSENSSVTIDRVSCIANFAKAVTEPYIGTDKYVSVLMDAASLRESRSESTGQDPATLAKFFDRLYVFSAAEYLSTDLPHLNEAVPGETATRVVPITTAQQASGSWALRPWG